MYDVVCEYYEQTNTKSTMLRSAVCRMQCKASISISVPLCACAFVVIFTSFFQFEYKLHLHRLFFSSFFCCIAFFFAYILFEYNFLWRQNQKNIAWVKCWPVLQQICAALAYDEVRCSNGWVTANRKKKKSIEQTKEIRNESRTKKSTDSLRERERTQIHCEPF